MAKFEPGGLVPRERLINRPLDSTHSRHAGEDFEKEWTCRTIRVGRDANRARIGRINLSDSEENGKKRRVVAIAAAETLVGRIK